MSTAPEIQAILDSQPNWKGETLSQLRDAIFSSDPGIAELVKWRMPSKPLGSISFEHNGIICVQDYLKSSVRLTFPKGAEINDPKGLFNCRLDSKTTRGIDFAENSEIDFEALREIVRSAVILNTKGGREK